MDNNPITDRIQNFYHCHLEDMTKKHSRVFQTRFDLHYPQDRSIPHDPKQIRDFSENLTRDLKRNNPLPQGNQKRSPGKAEPDSHSVDPRVIWVREQHDQSQHPHYHCLTLVNGNIKRKSYDIHKRAERQWGNALGLKETQGLVDHCDKQGESSVMIDRNKPDYSGQKETAQRQASYLAKSKGKDKTSKGFRRVGGTRIPKGD